MENPTVTLSDFWFAGLVIFSLIVWPTLFCLVLSSKLFFKLVVFAYDIEDKLIDIFICLFLLLYAVYYYGKDDLRYYFGGK